MPLSEQSSHYEGSIVRTDLGEQPESHISGDQQVNLQQRRRWSLMTVLYLSVRKFPVLLRRTDFKILGALCRNVVLRVCLHANKSTRANKPPSQVSTYCVRSPQLRIYLSD
jgi:hypothetical protein